GLGTIAQSGPGKMALQPVENSHEKPLGALPVAVRQFHPCGVAVRPSDGCLLSSETSGDSSGAAPWHAPGSAVPEGPGPWSCPHASRPRAVTRVSQRGRYARQDEITAPVKQILGEATPSQPTPRQLSRSDSGCPLEGRLPAFGKSCAVSYKRNGRGVTQKRPGRRPRPALVNELAELFL